MKIMKKFSDPEFAKARSKDCENVEWHWGLDEAEVLYCKGKIHGYNDNDLWQRASLLHLNMTYTDMQRVVDTFRTLQIPCNCDITILMAKGCQCGSIKK